MPERPLHISLVPMLKDNYAYLLHCYDTGATGIVDPSEAEPALQAARRQDWKIGFVLDTHHHADHCGGNLGIKEASGAKVVGPAYKLKLLLRQVGEGQLKVAGQLRKGDELQDVFEEYAHMVESLRTAQRAEIAALSEAIETCAQAGAPESGLTRLREVRDRMQRALD